jgi:fibronectin-binding autotransporter adhesin
MIKCRSGANFSLVAAVRTIVFFCIFLSSSLGWSAITNRWTNAISSTWSVTTNWSLAVAPSSLFDYTLITNAGTKTVTIDSTTLATNLTIRELTVSAPTGSTNTLQLVNLGNPLITGRQVNVNPRGVLWVTNSSITAQDLFDISGTLILDSGIIDTTPSLVDVRVGRTGANTGTVNLNGGSIKCFAFRVGDLNNAPGICNINGGSLLASSLATFGEIVNGPGTLNLFSGAFVVTNDITKVGNLASGTFNQSGGSSAMAFLSIGDNAPGTVNFSGGQMTVTPNTTLDVTRVGNFGTASFNISGGTVLLRGDFHVADNPGVIGSVLMTGGLLVATNDLVAIGRYGIGDMTVTNASAYFTNTSVGRHDGATGTLTIQNGGSVFAVDDLSIGRFTNSIGHVFVSGGLLSLTNDNIWAGRDGNGDLTVSSGLVRARSLFVGKSEDGTNTPSGTVTLNGGTLILSSNVIAGTSQLSTGQVTVAGGNLVITNAVGNNLLEVDNGSFSLTQGTVVADVVKVLSTNALFNFSGGTLQAKTMTVSNGMPFTVGDGINPATLQLQGGTYTFADGLVISSNATVTGCGTIIGPVSNNGNYLVNCGGVTITSILKSNATATVFFTTETNKNYLLEYKILLGDAFWTGLPPAIPGNGNVLSVQDSSATNASRFYRVHAQ